MGFPSRSKMNITLSLVAFVTIMGSFMSAVILPGNIVHAQTAGAGIKSHIIIVRPKLKGWMLADPNPQSNVINCPAVFGIQCYDPQQIQAAYGFNQLYNFGITGKGRTIVIIDAFQAPTIRADLRFFDRVFGLPDPVFKQITPNGTVPFSFNNLNQLSWDEEITLDVEWAHAIAPNAHITLVLSRTAADTDILKATKYAVDHNLGDVISQSFGEAEQCMDPALRAQQHRIFQEATRKHITLFASSGDDGVALPTCNGKSFFRAVSSPASDPLVTAVGGTKLDADPHTGEYHNEVTWNASVDPISSGASGGGFSVEYKAPDYQRAIPDVQRRHRQRGIPDVAYNASVDDGVLVFLTIPPLGGLLIAVFGGTSSGSPQWAAAAVLANQIAGHRLGFLNKALYGMGRLFNDLIFFHDITSGSNSFHAIKGFNAHKGWDAATGWGSPRANILVPLLAIKVGLRDGNGL